jgi:ABC-2 type transport system ATP-binding protein
MPPIVTLNQAAVRFGNRTALQPFSLEIPPGKRLALFGSAAAGKTTLLRLLSGELAPSIGSVVLPGAAHIGASIVAAPPRGIRSLMQWLERLPAMEGLSASVRTARATEALEALGLYSLRREPLSSLSGSQMAAASAAAAVCGRPSLILLDTSAGLLHRPVREALDALLRARASQGASVVRAVVDPEEAWRSDMLLMLHEGRSVACTSPDDLLAEFGRDTLTVEAADPQRVRKTLRGRFSIEVVEESPDVVVFRCRDGSSVAASLFRSPHGGISVVRLRRPDLWEIYRKVCAKPSV